MSEKVATALLSAARTGDRRAFDQLFAGQVGKLRGVLARMVGHPDDVDDLTQSALLKAYEGIESFRGESSAGTWLCAIGARLAIDHLRGLKRWRERAQVIYAASVLQSEHLAGEVAGAMSDPGFAFDVHQHIAYCFTCVGRTLEPQQQAALVLRDVLELSNDEAARALDLTQSVLRHELAHARETMRATFDGLCALVNKQGVCWQCAGLREVSPPGCGGPPVPDRIVWSERLRVVREAPVDDGCARAMHQVFFRHTELQEQQELGDPDVSTDCGRPDD